MVSQWKWMNRQMKTLSGSNDSRTITIAAVLLLLFAGQAAAFDFTAITSAPPEIMACMENELEPETMERIKAGQRPDDRNERKIIKKSYDKCLAATHPSKGIGTYDGPLFDAMSQIDETVDMKKAMANVRAAGVSKLGLFARSRKQLHQNEQAVLALAKKHPDLIVLGAPKYFQLSDDVTDDYINATVDGIKKHGYRFIGELLYTHADKSTGKQYSRGERYVDPSRPGTTRLLEAIGPFNIPFMAHWEPYAADRDFPRFHALYSAWPDQIFLLPHMGFASAETIDEFMGRHPNLYALTSKKERLMDNFTDPIKKATIGPAMLENGVLRPDWKALLIKYQDRILFASDPHMRKLWTKYGEVIEGQRLILKQLPRDVAEKIAYKNAEKLYGVSVR